MHLDTQDGFSKPLAFFYYPYQRKTRHNRLPVKAWKPMCASFS